MLKEEAARICTDLSYAGHSHVAGSCANGIEHVGSIRGKFLD